MKTEKLNDNRQCENVLWGRGAGVGHHSARSWVDGWQVQESLSRHCCRRAVKSEGPQTARALECKRVSEANRWTSPKGPGL